MKAFDIIDELTRDSYNERDGIFTADSATDMKMYLGQLFGKDYEIVFDKGNILNIDLSKERKFLYIYDERFPRRYDKDVFAILSVHDMSLIYLYEIE